jgi:sensor histidine kinase regulating citrate/malate metabolism
MAPSAAYNVTLSSNGGTKIRFNTPLVIGVIVAILVVMVALIIFFIWKRRRHVKKSNQIRQEAVETHRMLASPSK